MDASVPWGRLHCDERETGDQKNKDETVLVFWVCQHHKSKHTMEDKNIHKIFLYQMTWNSQFTRVSTGEHQRSMTAKQKFPKYLSSVDRWMMNTTRSIRGRLSSFLAGRGRLFASLLVGVSQTFWIQWYGCWGTFVLQFARHVHSPIQSKHGHQFTLAKTGRTCKVTTSKGQR